MATVFFLHSTVYNKINHVRLRDLTHLSTASNYTMYWSRYIESLRGLVKRYLPSLLKLITKC